MEKEILIWVALTVLLACLIALVSFTVSLLTLRRLRKELAKETSERKALALRLQTIEDELDAGRPTRAIPTSPLQEQQIILEEVDRRIHTATKEHMTMAVMDRKLEGSRDNWLLLVDHKIKATLENLPRNGSPAFADPGMRRLGALEAAIMAIGRNARSMNTVVKALFEVVRGMNDKKDVAGEIERRRQAVADADRLVSSIRVRVREEEVNLPPEELTEEAVDAYLDRHFSRPTFSHQERYTQSEKYRTDYLELRALQLEELSKARKDEATAEAELEADRRSLRDFESDPANRKALGIMKSLQELLEPLNQMEAAIVQAERDIRKSQSLHPPDAAAPAGSSRPAPPPPPLSSSLPPPQLPPPPRTPST